MKLMTNDPDRDVQETYHKIAWNNLDLLDTHLDIRLHIHNRQRLLYEVHPANPSRMILLLIEFLFRKWLDILTNRSNQSKTLVNFEFKGFKKFGTKNLNTTERCLNKTYDIQCNHTKQIEIHATDSWNDRSYSQRPNWPPNLLLYFSFGVYKLDHKLKNFVAIMTNLQNNNIAQLRLISTRQQIFLSLKALSLNRMWMLLTYISIGWKMSVVSLGT